MGEPPDHAPQLGRFCSVVRKLSELRYQLKFTLYLISSLRCRLYGPLTTASRLRIISYRSWLRHLQFGKGHRTISIFAQGRSFVGDSRKVVQPLNQIYKTRTELFNLWSEPIWSIEDHARRRVEKTTSCSPIHRTPLGFAMIELDSDRSYEH